MIKCKICSEKSNFYSDIKNIKLYKCNHCKLVFQSNIPINYQKNLYSYYSEFNNYDYDKLSFRKIKTEIFDNKFKIENKTVFIKIDVERHEYEALLGASNFLSKSNNKIFLQIEIVDRYKDKVLNLLKKYNFDLIGEVSKGGHDYYLSNFKL